MSLILSIETAVSVCSVALHDDMGLRGILEIHQENVHARKLMPAIKDLLEQYGVESTALEAVAVSEGPGSYTGLRIGVSTAKGIAFAHQIPLIGISTLDALAAPLVGLVEDPSFIIPMIDARRMEVYSKVFDHGMVEQEALSPVIVDEMSYREYLEMGRVYFCGDGADKVSKVVKHPNARFLKVTNSASSIGELALHKFRKKDFVDIAYFEPNYLKEFRVLKSKKNPLAL
ncbi:tRNA (adenosine(37)-N6)-threonylcarbamoyltransferase complex dimerization subunit type 1 TsaB [Echinicola strongylocentroti]|uniref:tRNA (Adenosine(37)-N6)-threonylcarbamoyltransferase complex dimerization subunit type 1 TsaB n=1 Tax=Echinicola strongylocentroti TaxID=1795355 RepID=A0A2Z4IK51_9BACT|nr:tRNA (adenosine(37)-N6)-threonylcarbamoyltransferase complex dimerization subunit type 1 TsaB [Echinicola strongylocentroti]AWW31315.1 tRNA (adenosine(37)-N6)-threonylcarbamoyltransferase complex dimerization subunit type 1 TsaB [Echinicola strongylocentroti]